MREIKVISFSFQIFCTLGYCSIKLLDEEEIKSLKNEIIENGKYYRQSGTMLFEIEKENYSISII
ncbi:MAG: hypothetical protein JW924_00640 [Fusobacteriaceae bacterium]|nr:hypothetical protein [Fusobacteriaceae bacterium]